MALNEDIAIGLQATVNASREEVVNACLNAASVLGSHAQATAASAKVTVKIFPGLVQKLSKVSPLVGVTLKPSTNDTIEVIVRIEKYVSLQSKFFLIPMGPKRLMGKATYMNFLSALEQELRAINNGGGRIQRIGESR